jgi:hypothetical protein
MTQTGKRAEYAGPDGSLFLPRNERDLENFKLALLLGRGPAAGMTLDEIETHYRSAAETLAELRQKVVPEITAVALASEI